MSNVAVKECKTYLPQDVYRKIKEGLESIGSISSFVKSGDKVLIKPNMLTAGTPQQAINTHQDRHINQDIVA